MNRLCILLSIFLFLLLSMDNCNGTNFNISEFLPQIALAPAPSETVAEPSSTVTVPSVTVTSSATSSSAASGGSTAAGGGAKKTGAKSKSRSKANAKAVTTTNVIIETTDTPQQRYRDNLALALNQIVRDLIKIKVMNKYIERGETAYRNLMKTCGENRKAEKVI